MNRKTGGLFTHTSYYLYLFFTCRGWKGWGAWHSSTCPSNSTSSNISMCNSITESASAFSRSWKKCGDLQVRLVHSHTQGLFLPSQHAGAQQSKGKFCSSWLLRVSVDTYNKAKMRLRALDGSHGLNTHFILTLLALMCPNLSPWFPEELLQSWRWFQTVKHWKCYLDSLNQTIMVKADSHRDSGRRLTGAVKQAQLNDFC